jgi:hypothetical protein
VNVFQQLTYCYIHGSLVRKRLKQLCEAIRWYPNVRSRKKCVALLRLKQAYKIYFQIMIWVIYTTSVHWASCNTIKLNMLVVYLQYETSIKTVMFGALPLLAM